MRIAVKWGVMLGVAVCAWTLIVHALGFYTTDLQAGQYADVAATALPVAILFLAIRERRASNPDGALSVRQGVATGVVAGLVSVPITAAFLWVYHHYVNPDWLNLLVAFEERRMATSGSPPQAIAGKVASLRSGGTDRAQLTGALVGTTILSALISLVWSLVLRRREIPRLPA